MPGIERGPSFCFAKSRSTGAMARISSKVALVTRHPPGRHCAFSTWATFSAWESYSRLAISQVEGPLETAIRGRSPTMTGPSSFSLARVAALSGDASFSFTRPVGHGSFDNCVWMLCTNRAALPASTKARTKLSVCRDTRYAFSRTPSRHTTVWYMSSASRITSQLASHRARPSGTSSTANTTFSPVGGRPFSSLCRSRSPGLSSNQDTSWLPMLFRATSSMARTLVM
mmetsp:Transcript_96076/g.165648  ORF Transcript_96076/g.165648 Transcript_96076/m.165648 type:complete len:228 (-) Transcript_96076:537-1220(-)